MNLNLILKETSRAEHEFMTIHHPYNVLVTALARELTWYAPDTQYVCQLLCNQM